MGKIIFLIIALLSYQTNENDYYENGKDHLEKGDWKKALNVWFEAKNNLKSPEQIDPRIGIEFIRVVTQKKEEKYYPIATELYYWALDCNTFSKYEISIQEEVNRILPLLEDKEKKIYASLLEKQDVSVLKKLKEYWINNNPFPSSRYNERLIEHWTRINFSKKNYTRASNSPYNTDDRGTLYVKYGQPDNIKSEIITVNKVTNPHSGEIIYLSNNVSFKVEIWYYNDINESNQSIYIFGRPGNGGIYGLQTGILNMVPAGGNRIAYYNENSNSFNFDSGESQDNSGTTSNLINTSEPVLFGGQKKISRDGAELMLQYAVMEEIAGIDKYHNNLFNDMTYDLIQSMKSGRGEPFSNSARQNLKKYLKDELRFALKRDTQNPSNVSNTSSDIENIDINIEIFRFLNNNFSPEYLLAVKPENINDLLSIYFLRNNIETSSDVIKLLNSIYFYNDSWDKTNHIPFTEEILPNDLHRTNAYILTDNNLTLNSNLIFESQILNFKPSEDEQRLHNIYNAGIIGSSGPSSIELPEPLTVKDESSHSNIIVSDIFFANHQIKSDSTRFPVNVSINSEFDQDDEPMVYFEVYGIPKNENYQVNVFFEELKESKIKDISDFTISLDYKSEGRVNKNWFIIDLNNLKKNKDYNLVLEFLRMEKTQIRKRKLTVN